MIETITTVVKTQEHRVWVLGSQDSGCNACQQKAGCSINNLDTLLNRKAIPVDSQIALQVGDQVVVAINEKLLLRASLLQYILPLIIMFLGAGIAEQVLKDSPSEFAELWVAGAALSGLLLSLWLINKLQRLWLFSFWAVPTVVKKII